MQQKYPFLAVILAGFLSCDTAFAHHGNAAYEDAVSVTLTGVVTKFEFSNPHVYVYLDAKDDKGRVTHWSLENASPERMARLGWRKNSLEAGDQVTVTVSAARNGSPVGYLTKLLFSDGRELKTRMKRPTH